MSEQVTPQELGEIRARWDAAVEQNPTVEAEESFTDNCLNDMGDLFDEIRRLQELTATCTCTPHPYGDGPEPDCPIHGAVRAHNEAARERDRLRAAVEAGEASDGYHTHNELYEYRMLYNAHAADGWLAAGIPVVKSWRHADGEQCFGGGWFIVTADLPSGQVSNHYAAEHWHLFAVPEVDLPPEWDGHTPADAADRLRRHLEQEGL